MKRMPAEMRKSPETLKAIRGLPWKPNPSGGGATVQIALDDSAPAVPKEQLPSVVEAVPRELRTRRTYI